MYRMLLAHPAAGADSGEVWCTTEGCITDGTWEGYVQHLRELPPTVSLRELGYDSIEQYREANPSALPEGRGQQRSVFDPPSAEHAAAMVASTPGADRALAAALPEGRREGDERCSSESMGYRCTKPAGHEGWHHRYVENGVENGFEAWSPAVPLSVPTPTQEKP